MENKKQETTFGDLLLKYVTDKNHGTIKNIYNNLDDRKNKLQELRFKYNKLMHWYKDLLVENVNLRTQVKNN